MKIILGADHGGYELKNKLKEHLASKGVATTDVGTFSEDSVDYPDIVQLAAQHYFDEKADFIILTCGTGIGVSISANKIKGIFCALLYDNRTARLARSHNNANCIALGGREMTIDVAKDVVDTFLASSPSESDRHIRRRDKVKDLDKRSVK